MATPLSKTLQCSTSEPHNVHYWEWLSNASRTEAASGTTAPTLVCCHGLTRNGTDFDALASSLIADPRLSYLNIVCPDVVGRGKSDWLNNKKQDYGYPLYVADMAQLVQHTAQGQQIDWVGTSMGGLIGMMLAASPNSNIRRLVINDIGPLVTKDPLVRIANYLNQPRKKFADIAEAVAYFKAVHAPFALTDEQFLTLAKNSVKQMPEGHYEVLYDAEIGHALRDTASIADVNLWVLWDMIKCPVMLVRGAESDLLTPEVVEEMKRRGPGLARYLEVAGVGHAPGLMTPDQLEPIQEFLTTATL